ncbi:MAG: T9SS type A sorting domain-containing protein, partial [Bacteroidales bacterium]|nr:T9SS type A sorting domain-containing protein [Bacteroidales bacterium]
TTSFTWLTPYTPISNTTWLKHIEENIPPAATYIAIRYQGDYNYYVYIDSLVIDGKVAPATDLSITGITYPAATNTDLSAAEQVTVTVKNNGYNAANSYKMYLSVNGATPIEESQSTPINPFGTVNYTFTSTLDFSNDANYNLKVWVEVTGDSDHANDTVVKTVNNKICSVSSFPYILDFQEKNYGFLDCWTFSVADQTNTNISYVGLWLSIAGTDTNYYWGFASANTVPSGKYSMYLISPNLSETTENKTFSFDYMVYSATTPESFVVGYISNEDSVIWFNTETVTDTTWKLYIREDIPGNAKNIILGYISSKKSILFVDNIKIDKYVPVIDLRVNNFVNLPALVQIGEGEVANVPVVINVRNDGEALAANSAAFVYKVETAQGADHDYAYLLYTEGIAADNTPFDYTFSSEEISFGSEGLYKISAWAEVAGNLHNDTIKADINVVKRSVSSDNISIAEKINVYPNPSNGNFKVDVDKRTTMEIISFNGAVLYKEVITGKSEFSLRAKGLYLLRFIDEQGKETTKRLIVK